MEIPKTISPIRDEKQLPCSIKNKINHNAQIDHNKVFHSNQWVSSELITFNDKRTQINYLKNIY